MSCFSPGGHPLGPLVPVLTPICSIGCIWFPPSPPISPISPDPPIPHSPSSPPYSPYLPSAPSAPSSPIPPTVLIPPLTIYLVNPVHPSKLLKKYRHYISVYDNKENFQAVQWQEPSLPVLGACSPRKFLLFRMVKIAFLANHETLKFSVHTLNNIHRSDSSMFWGLLVI